MEEGSVLGADTGRSECSGHGLASLFLHLTFVVRSTGLGEGVGALLTIRTSCGVGTGLAFLAGGKCHSEDENK